MKNILFRFLTMLLYGLTLLLLIATAAAHLGRWDWRADLFSHFVAHYAALALLATIGLLALGRRQWALIATAVFVLQVYQLTPLWHRSHHGKARGAEREKITVLQFNGKFTHPQPENVVDWILFNKSRADVVVLLEVSEKWNKALRRLQKRYPHHAVELRDSPFGIGVFTDLPGASLRLKHIGARKLPAAVLRAVTREKKIPFVLYAAHPTPPISRALSDLRDRDLLIVAGMIASEPQQNKILVGDLNTTQWSPSFKLLAATAGLYDAQEGFGFHPTWPVFGIAKIFGVPIDHTLVSPSIRIVDRIVGPDLKSDHLPVMTIMELSRPQRP